MFIRHVPIEDLIDYIQQFTGIESIPNLIVKHYFSVTNLNIESNKDFLFSNWCFCDHGLIKNNNYPRIDGLLLKNGKQIAILIDDHIFMKQNKKYITHTFSPKDWVEWGVMTQLYDYRGQGYQGHQNCLFGSRKLQFGDVGSDVMQLQSLLDDKVTGEFNKETEALMVALQQVLGDFSANGIFDPSQESVMNFLIRKHNEYNS